MNNLSKMAFGIFAVLGMIAIPALAQGPATNPNGFPSGDHYNLNIIGKNSSFACPAQEFDDAGNPIYGNVVFVPEYGTGDILLKSGSGRKSAIATTLQVTDPCVTAIDGDPAEVLIPAAADGYWVYARALGKLTDNQYMRLEPGMVTVSPEVEHASTEADSELYLGYVTSNGFSSEFAGTITRLKGKHPAIPINELFEWSGDVCYSVDPFTFGLGEEGAYPPKDVCLLDANGDGKEDIVGYPDETTGLCAEGSLTNLYCQWYDTDWVFNIADFVNYLLGATNNYSKLVQIRLYPR